MIRFRFTTAGETHGPALVCVVEGLPAGMPVRAEELNRQLARRQAGYGRGERMQIERDEVEILSGVRFGKTLGSPVSMMLRNRDWENWRVKMSREASGKAIDPLDTARPGHADLPGVLKYDHGDVRNVLERASARETAARAAAGALARIFLREMSVGIVGQVLSIGNVRVRDGISGSWKSAEGAEGNDLRMADPVAASKAARVIDRAKQRGSTVGGIVEVIARGVPPGLGSYVSWDRRLDGRLAQALMSIHAIKGVEIGGGMEVAVRYGNQVHDEIFPGKGAEPAIFGGLHPPFHRRTNRAGGIEGGMTNGSPVIVRAAMKPIPTQSTPLRTVRIGTWKRTTAHRERSDVCAVPAASVVAESMVATVLADAFLEKFGGESMREIKYNYAGYLRRAGFR